MRNFSTEKDKLLANLNSEIKNNPKNEILKSLSWTLESYESISDLNGALSRIVVDCLGFEFKIGENLTKYLT